MILVWPCRFIKHSPEPHLQIFAVLSKEPVNTKAPSDEKTADEIPHENARSSSTRRGRNSISSRCCRGSPLTQKHRPTRRLQMC
jgi:hypothetical protein